MNGQLLPNKEQQKKIRRAAAPRAAAWWALPTTEDKASALRRGHPYGVCWPPCMNIIFIFTYLTNANESKHLDAGSIKDKMIEMILFYFIIIINEQRQLAP